MNREMKDRNIKGNSKLMINKYEVGLNASEFEGVKI